MSSNRDDGPVYYREIQKNAYLKRIPSEVNTNKLRPLGHKRPPLRPMWTLFCVHNGRTPFLEQYSEPDPSGALAHRPAWRACLRTARHVTASVKPHVGDEYDFLIDTDQGPVRMLAPDWESMQDWVTILRNKLHELRILAKGENVYCAAPVAPPPRAAARDPTSPLPPTPPVPPDRVPGIELSVPSPPPAQPTESTNHSQAAETSTNHNEDLVDISSWDLSLPSTSTTEPRNVARICGQNICLDDSILKREPLGDEFVADYVRDDFGGDNFGGDDFVGVEFVAGGGDDEFVGEQGEVFTQRVVVGDGQDRSANRSPQRANVTVIQVCNRPERTYSAGSSKSREENTQDPRGLNPGPGSFVNIIHTDMQPQYGHLSLTTTVSLTGETQDSVYERLCMASTSDAVTSAASDDSANVTTSVNCVDVPTSARIREHPRKSSLPNLEPEPAYEYLYPNSSHAVQESRTTTDSNLLSSIPRAIRPNVERSQSQNACDSPRLGENQRPLQNSSPKRENKTERSEQTKPIWRRGLTELSLLSRLRGLGQNKRQESPTRQDQENLERGVTSPAKVVHRSRPQSRVDSTRRRSNSLSNGQSPSRQGPMAPLRARQAAALRAEQRRGAAVAASVSVRDPPVFADYERQVWVARWGAGGARCGGRAGDRVAALAGTPPTSAAHARMLIKASHTNLVDILFHRVPLGKIYVVSKRDRETLGLRLDSECVIRGVMPSSGASLANLPPPSPPRWAVTEVNNRTLDLLKGGDEEVNRLSLHGSEASIIIQPAPLVKKLRAAIKAHKSLLSLR